MPIPVQLSFDFQSPQPERAGASGVPIDQAFSDAAGQMALHTAKRGPTTVAVKITDMLGEEVLVAAEV